MTISVTNRPGAKPAAITDIPDLPAPSRTWTDWSCRVRLAMSDPSSLPEAADELVLLMAQIANAASRFDPSSELSISNRANGRPIEISDTLAELVRVAVTAASQTNGLVDPTVGRDLIDIGYDRDITQVRAGTAAQHPPDATSKAARPRTSWRDIELIGQSLRLPPECFLDLGATAKSHTADLAARQLSVRYGCPVLVEIGGDVAVAGRRDWRVRVAEYEGGPAQHVILSRGGLATSTTTVRRWSEHGQPAHHIIDPRTGHPADGSWRTVTVAAESALRANTCSTAAIVLGDDAVPWLRAQNVPVRLVSGSGQIVVLNGWPQPSASARSAARTARRTN